MVTNLIYHHDSQKIADCSKEEAIQVVLHRIADLI